MTLVHKALPALRRLLPPGARVLVATSGGPDSQALLHVIATLAQELQLEQVFAAGINHGLRAAADDELDLAATLAASLGVSFARLRVQVAHRGNLLANARAARYRCLLAHADALCATRLAVAHTADDQAETVLFRLVRGSGLLGASAMPERRGRLVRPLLEATRGEILAYLAQHGIRYAVDPSNSDPRRMRARLRAEVMPALLAINAGAVANLGRFALRARRADAALARLMRSKIKRHLGPSDALSMDALKDELAEYVLAAWLRRRGIRKTSRRELMRVLALRREGAGAEVGGRRVTLSRGHLWLCCEPAGPVDVNCPGRTVLSHSSMTLDVSVLAEHSPCDWSTWCSSTRVAFDADKLHLPLSVRSVLPGDRMQLFGGRFETKVGDLFTNLKVPTPLRATWPLLTDGNNVAWVVGLKRSAVAPVTNDTRRVLVVEIDGALPWSPVLR